MTSTLAKGLALGRVAFGAGMLAQPERVARVGYAAERSNAVAQ